MKRYALIACLLICFIGCDSGGESVSRLVGRWIAADFSGSITLDIRSADQANVSGTGVLRNLTGESRNLTIKGRFNDPSLELTLTFSGTDTTFNGTMSDSETIIGVWVVEDIRFNLTFRKQL